MTTPPQEPLGEEQMPCGHPQSAVVQADEGTAYCRSCAEESQIALSEAERQKALRLAETEWREDPVNVFKRYDAIRRALLATDALLQEAQRIIAEIEEQAPPTPEEWHAMCDRAEAAEEELGRLREALDSIEASPEDPLEVQRIARAALQAKGQP